MILGSARTLKDKSSLESEYMAFLQAGIQREQNAEIEYSNYKAGIPTAVSRYRSSEEELRDIQYQKELSLKTLRILLPYRDDALQFSIQLEQNNDLVNFNRFSKSFQDEVKSMPNMTKDVLTQLWKQFKFKKEKDREDLGTTLEAILERILQLKSDAVQLGLIKISAELEALRAQTSNKTFREQPMTVSKLRNLMDQLTGYEQRINERQMDEIRGDFSTEIDEIVTTIQTTHTEIYDQIFLDKIQEASEIQDIEHLTRSRYRETSTIPVKFRNKRQAFQYIIRTWNALSALRIHLFGGDDWYRKLENYQWYINVDDPTASQLIQQLIPEITLDQQEWLRPDFRNKEQNATQIIHQLDQVVRDYEYMYGDQGHSPFPQFPPTPPSSMPPISTSATSSSLLPSPTSASLQLPTTPPPSQDASVFDDTIIGNMTLKELKSNLGRSYNILKREGAFSGITYDELIEAIKQYIARQKGEAPKLSSTEGNLAVMKIFQQIWQMNVNLDDILALIPSSQGSRRSLAPDMSGKTPMDMSQMASSQKTPHGRVSLESLMTSLPSDTPLTLKGSPSMFSPESMKLSLAETGSTDRSSSLNPARKLDFSGTSIDPSLFGSETQFNIQQLRNRYEFAMSKIENRPEDLAKMNEFFNMGTIQVFDPRLTGDEIGQLQCNLSLITESAIDSELPDHEHLGLTLQPLFYDFLTAINGIRGDTTILRQIEASRATRYTAIYDQFIAPLFGNNTLTTLGDNTPENASILIHPYLNMITNDGSIGFWKPVLYLLYQNESFNGQIHKILNDFLQNLASSFPEIDSIMRPVIEKCMNFVNYLRQNNPTGGLRDIPSYLYSRYQYVFTIGMLIQVISQRAFGTSHFDRGMAPVYERMKTPPEPVPTTTGKGLLRMYNGKRIKIGRGLDVTSKEKFQSFGDKLIDVHSLEQGWLNIRFNSLATFNRIKPRSISNQLKEFLLDCLQNHDINYRQFKYLKKDDQDLFRQMCKFSKVSIESDSDNDVFTDKIKRFNLLKGEILAGNNHPSLLQELKETIYDFVQYGLITKYIGNSILQEISVI